MAQIIIKSNALQGTDVEIDDLGIQIPSGGGQDTFSDQEFLSRIRVSVDLRGLVIDNAFGVGSSTLILNDGSSDIAQDDALDFLDSFLEPDGAANYGFLKLDGAGAFDAQSNVISNVATPVQDGDAAPKSYVDAVANGLTVKDPARALASANVTLSGTQTVDGVSLVDGDRVLLTAQTTGSGSPTWSPAWNGSRSIRVSSRTRRSAPCGRTSPVGCGSARPETGSSSARRCGPPAR